MDGSALSPRSSSARSIFGAEDLEAGFSGEAAVAAAPLCRRQRTSRLLEPARFFCDDLPDEEPRHFLDSCFLCRKPLSGNRDIFMYRGDMPFCSEECRQEQIELDDAREKNWKIAVRKERQPKQMNSSSQRKSQGIHVRPGTVVAG
ncbi:hypothetical protein AXF42_Ash013363 [Apostasia shenzhenica]|uniref:FLZ-type domain-containing protein n=1 Tax=Apostasia shenzhenica TaxID=1088818 RepID=A0A2I0A414_9ASPA|nr:hypothetical protein AXF42_Ash013363 [Apostasia shenzhenica]